MENYNIIYDPETMEEHSVHEKSGRNILKKLLESYKTGGTASFAQSAPTPPAPTGPPTLSVPTGPPTLTRSLATSRVPTPTPSLPG